jgi:hypothetical protein
MAARSGGFSAAIKTVFTAMAMGPIGSTWWMHRPLAVINDGTP